MSLRKGNTLISGVGIDGTNGTNGQDGFSPSASVSKVGSISTLTVTDANGTTSTEILDGGQIIQYPVVPTASADNLGQIIQFTGTTDSTYTNGYFYKCVSDGQSTPTYSWQSVSVQENVMPRYFIDGDYLFYYISPGDYTITAENTTGSGSSYVPSQEVAEALNLAHINSKMPALIIPSIKSNLRQVAYFLGAGTPSLSSTTYSFYGPTVSSRGWYSVALSVGLSNSNNQFVVTTVNRKGSLLYALGLTNIQAYTPSGDYNPSTKLYTDKTHYENMSGYDATKTQTLKNVNGTLTWVDD